MQIKNITFGADPELFLKARSNGHYVSAVGKIGGSKEKPLSLASKGLPGAAVQEDNVAVEFNIPACKDKESFVRSIADVLTYLTNWANDRQYDLALDASALFPQEELKSLQALEFGCEPDFNAWLVSENPAPLVPDDMYNLRSAGGHLHLGYLNPDPDISMDIIKHFDVFIGCPAVLLDKDKLRRKLYGKAGAFRFKDYGVEYRTLSNFWLRSREYTEWVITQAQKAIEYYNNEGAFVDEKVYPLVDQIINNGNVEALHDLKKQFPIGTI